MSASALDHAEVLRPAEVLVDRPPAEIGMTTQQHRGPNGGVGASEQQDKCRVVNRWRWPWP